MCDLYLRENIKSRPRFARDQSPYKGAVRDFFIKERQNPEYLKAYAGCDARQVSRMVHVEVLGDGKMILFDYRDRDPLSYNGKAVEIGRIKLE